MIEYNIGISLRILAPFGTGKKAFGGFNGFFSGEAVGEGEIQASQGGKKPSLSEENAS